MKNHAENQRCFIYVGTYNTKDQESIHVFSFDKEEGTINKIKGVSGINNPSFLTLDSKGHMLYSVSEVEKGQVYAYRILQKTGELEYLNQQSTQGSSPCYVSLDPSDQWLFSVNYMGGSIGMYPIYETGEIGEQADHIHFSGYSVHPERQEAPHPHSIKPLPYRGGHVIVSDLGTDHVQIYQNDVLSNSLKEVSRVEAAKGAGPRHFAFHPSKPLIYVVEELTSSITVYALDEKNLSMKSIQTISTLPMEYSGENTSAEVKIDSIGKHLYASNRGHDSLACYQILRDGTLECIDYVSTQGKTPRHFNILPDSPYLLIANQESDSIVVMHINKNGIPVFTGETVQVKSPVCIQFLNT